MQVALPNLASRPADILCRATFGKPLALDVTVSHPLRLSASIAARGEVAASAEAAELRKRHTSQLACAQAGWGFRPVAFETTGGLGTSAIHTCRKLSRYLCMRRGVAASVMSMEIARSISLALAKGKGEMLAASSPTPC